jgi:putative N6-adenine-specific DNA methylase
MMARGIPPGLSRGYRIQSLPFHDRTLFEKIKDVMKSRIYPSGSYQISAHDMSPEMIECAERNAERAGVGKDIRFEMRDFLTSDASAFTVTNPPYGNRLESDDLDAIYKKLIKSVSSHGGGFITTYPVDVRF